MEPTFLAGDHLLVEPMRRGGRQPLQGDVVLARHPASRATLVIKRVGRRDQNSVWLSSDNPARGTDSRHFGPVRASEVVGIVTLSIGNGGGVRLHSGA
jgi:nickel-type superoxide dismutase maturation protease